MQKAMPAGRQGFTVPPILLGVLILGVIFGFFYIQKNPAEKNIKVNQVAKESIKKYSNQKLGFEFQSKDFKVLEDSEEEFNKRGNGNFRKNFKGYVGYEPGEFLGAVVVLDKSSSYETNPLTIWVFENNNLTIAKWYEKFWYYPFVWGDFTYTGKSTLAPKEDATVSGQLGKFGIIDYQPGKPKFIYLSKDDRMYLFRIIGEEGNQILSTFKFL